MTDPWMINGNESVISGIYRAGPIVFQVVFLFPLLPPCPDTLNRFRKAQGLQNNGEKCRTQKCKPLIHLT